MTAALPFRPATAVSLVGHGLLAWLILAAPTVQTQAPKILQVSLLSPMTESRPQVAQPAPQVKPRPTPLARTSAEKTLPQEEVPLSPAPAAQQGESAIVPARFDADYLHNPAPPYPALAKRMGEEGTVRLRVKVTPEGTAEAVELKASSGSPRLDQAAVDTVRRWRFVPARQGEKTISAWVVVPIRFHLNQES